MIYLRFYFFFLFFILNQLSFGIDYPDCFSQAILYKRELKTIIEVNKVRISLGPNVLEALKRKGITEEEVAEAYAQGYSQAIPGKFDPNGMSWVIGQTQSGKIISMSITELEDSDIQKALNIRIADQELIQLFQNKNKSLKGMELPVFFNENARRSLVELNLNETEVIEASEKYFDHPLVQNKYGKTSYSIVISIHNKYYFVRYSIDKVTQKKNILQIFTARNSQVEIFSRHHPAFSAEYIAKMSVLPLLEKQADLLKLNFSTHAENQLKKLKLSKEEIEYLYILRIPEEDFVDEAKENRFFVVQNYNKINYKITYHLDSNTHKPVITDIQIANNAIVQQWNTKNPPVFTTLQVQSGEKIFHIHFSAKLERKLKVIHSISKEEMIEVFQNRKHAILKTSRSEENTSHDISDFFSRTNDGRLLRVVFKNKEGSMKQLIIAVYEPDENQIKKYKERIQLSHNENL